MMVARRRQFGVARALFLVFLTLEAASQEPSIRLLHPDRDELASIRESGTMVVIGRYQGLVQDEIQLVGVPLRFSLARPELAKQLAKFRTNKDNMAISGNLLPGDSPDGKDREFVVEALDAAPADEKLFKDTITEILADPDRKSEEIVRLGRKIHRVYLFERNSALMPLLTKVVFEGFRIGKRRLDPQDADGHLHLIMRIFGLIPDTQTHAELLKYQVGRFPEHDATKNRLVQLGLRNVEGKWLDYADFKTHEGFVRYQDRWIKRSDVELIRVLQVLVNKNLTNLILRSRTDRAYAQLASLGQVEKGMNYEEVSEALGFPDRVRRRRHRSLEVDQWDYGDQRVYFLNGQAYVTVQVEK